MVRRTVRVLGEAQSHGFNDVPFVVAGGGAYHNRLLVSVCHFMGRTEVNTFGNLDEGSGPLSGLLYLS
ncbi:MAG: hypothetical protein K1X64_04895 [Myxococcaceae bacterium]|nr:hypothetical protein [Myxococcaceae bacterium]